MKGIEIRFRGRIIHIADKHRASVFIHQRNGYFHINVSGFNEKSKEMMMSHIWLDSEIKIGEALKIEVKDIDKTSKPSEIKTAFSNTPLTKKEIEKMFIEKLNNFYILEKLLEKEGLI